MNRPILFRILAGIILLAAIVGIAFLAFNVGVTHGIALNVAQASGSQATAQQAGPYFGWGWGAPYGHPFPFLGFGCFVPLIALFLLFLAFGALRRLLWGGPRWGWYAHRHHGWGENGPWGNEVPPMVAEWHRRMHAEPPTDETTKK